MAMDDFDIFSHQPHPPGFPAYVYMAKGLNHIINDHQYTLSLLSCLAGAFSITFMFLLGCRSVSRGTGLLAASILFVSPMFFQMSLVIMSDVVVVPFFLGSSYFLLSGHIRGARYNYVYIAVAGLLMGWGVGVRPQWLFLFIVIAMSFVFVSRSHKLIACLVIPGVIGTLSWLVPVSLSHGGFLKYVDFAQGHYYNHMDLVLGLNFFSLRLLLKSLFNGWQITLSLLLIFFLAAPVLYFIDRKTAKNSDGTQANIPFFTGIGCLLFITALLFYIFFHLFHIQRYIVPLLPPLSFTLAVGICSGIQLIAHKTIRYIFVTVIILSLLSALSYSLTCARLIQTTPPPQVQAAIFIKANYSPDNTLLLPVNSTRQWQHYLAEFTITPRWEVEENSMEAFSPVGKLQGYTNIISEKELGLAERKVNIFRSKYFDHLDSGEVQLYQYELDKINFFLVTGHFQQESWGTWITDKASGWIRNNRRNGEKLCFEVRSSFQHPRKLEVSINDQLKWHGEIGQNKTGQVILLPDSKDWNKISLSTPDGCLKPVEVTGATDHRCLSFSLSVIQTHNLTKDDNMLKQGENKANQLCY